jgi:arylsulfatase A-like enzyme
MIRPSAGPRTGRLFLPFSGLVLLLLFPGCGPAPKPANILLITLDTQRADHISAYNPSRAATPNIDFLAREGVLFKNAYSLIPITVPSHASLFFSEPPHRIRNYNNGQSIPARRSRPSVVNLFRKKGFATAAFVSLGVLSSEFGLGQGFEDYVDDFPPDRWYLSAGEVNARVFPWLERNGRRPFFVLVHNTFPHHPYAPPDSPNDFNLYLNDRLVAETSLQKYTLNEAVLHLEPGLNRLRIEFRNEFDDRPDHFIGRLDRFELDPPPSPPELEVDFGRGLYLRPDDRVVFFQGISLMNIRNGGGRRQVKLRFRGRPVLDEGGAAIGYRREVEYMDGEIGRLWEKLRELGIYDKTAVLLAGDHGEGLGEFHNEFGDPHLGHIHYLYDIYLRVPIILRAPNERDRGAVRPEFVTLLDVAPTLTALAGIEPLPHFRGRNLLRPDKNESPAIFEETYRPEAYEDRFGLLSPPWHLILTPRKDKYEMYNLETDPWEEENLFDSRSRPQELMTLKQKLEEFAREILAGKQEVQVDDRAKEMLRALGYVR